MRLCRFQIHQIYQSTSFISCILLRSLSKNAAFLAFFCVLNKRKLPSFRSFTFFIKECCVLCVLFGFISHTKVTNLEKKECNTKIFFSINTYIYLYIYIYLHIYLYIYIYWKKERGLGINIITNITSILLLLIVYYLCRLCVPYTPNSWHSFTPCTPPLPSSKDCLLPHKYFL